MVDGAESRMTLASVAWRSLVRRPLRAAVTTVGVAVATGAYLALVSLATGLQRDAEGIATSLGAELVVQQAGAPVPYLSRLEPDDLAALTRMPQLRAVSPLVVGVTQSGPSSQVLVLGADPSTFPLTEIAVVDGRMLERGRGEILVGQTGARILGLAVGDRVELMRRHVVVVSGVFRARRGYLDSAVVVDLGQAQDVFRLGSGVSMALVRVHDPRRLDEALEAIETEIPHLAASSPELWSALDQHKLEVVSRFARAIGLVALFLAALGVANAVLMNLMERLPELAMLRAVGWTRRQVVLLVLAEMGTVAAAAAALSVPVAQVVLAALADRQWPWLASPQLETLPVVEGIVLAFLATLAGSIPGVVLVLRERPARSLRAS